MKKKRKAYTVDAMVRFFIQYYNIPTKQDIEKILTRIDRLEASMKTGRLSATSARKTGRRKTAGKARQASKGRTAMTATEKVVNIVKKFPKGVDVPGLKAKSGFEDKKIRNILFRLSKQGIVRRVGRGIYAIK